MHFWPSLGTKNYKFVCSRSLSISWRCVSLAPFHKVLICRASGFVNQIYSRSSHFSVLIIPIPPAFCLSHSHQDYPGHRGMCAPCVCPVLHPPPVAEEGLGGEGGQPLKGSPTGPKEPSSIERLLGFSQNIVKLYSCQVYLRWVGRSLSFVLKNFPLPADLFDK